MILKKNDVLHIHINSIDEEESKQEYKSRVVEIRDQLLIVEVPMSEQTGRFKRLYYGDELSCNFSTAEGVKHFFNSAVLGFTEDVVRLVKIKRPTANEITKVQRRDFLRVPAELDVAVRFSEDIQFVVKTEDVGGGGISFIIPPDSKVEQNMLATCWILVEYKNGQIEHISFVGEAVRLKPLDDGNFLVMMRYTDITERDRQKIIRYCFERQLELRNKTT